MRRRHGARGHREGACVKTRASPRSRRAAAAALLSLAGCATAPVRPAAQWLGVLPDSATLYVSLDVQRSADVLRSALEQAGPDLREVEPLLERTDRLYAAVETVEGSSPRVSMVALGSYPAGLIRSRLCGSRSWKTVKSPAGKYYVSSKAGLQVGVPGGYAVLVVDGVHRNPARPVRGADRARDAARSGRGHGHGRPEPVPARAARRPPRLAGRRAAAHPRGVARSPAGRRPLRGHGDLQHGLRARCPQPRAAPQARPGGLDALAGPRRRQRQAEDRDGRGGGHAGEARRPLLREGRDRAGAPRTRGGSKGASGEPGSGGAGQ